MNLFEPTHLIIVAVIVLLLFGGEKLPELMRNVGKGVGELKRGIDEGKRQLTSAMEEHASSHDDHQQYGQQIDFVPPNMTVKRDTPEDHEVDHGTGSAVVEHPTETGHPGGEEPHK
jgi:sec-independent protein translocase protein TatA